MLRAIADVMDERQRQINVEGWTAEHDDQYKHCELALAAAAYAMNTGFPADSPPFWWPFSRKWWKPRNERHDLVRAAALLIARIEQIDRKASVSSARPA